MTKLYQQGSTIFKKWEEYSVPGNKCASNLSKIQLLYYMINITFFFYLGPVIGPLKGSAPAHAPSTIPWGNPTEIRDQKQCFSLSNFLAIKFLQYVLIST